MEWIGAPGGNFWPEDSSKTNLINHSNQIKGGGFIFPISGFACGKHRPLIKMVFKHKKTGERS
jgi:hypothetical protein